MKNIIITLMLLIVAGCVGSPIHSTLAYSGVRGKIDRNNKNIMVLKIGMTKSEVREQMGEPERSDGYPWGSAWLYRTAMTQGIQGGIYGSIDSDYTPIMFDTDDVLVGWGRNYFTEYVRKYEITVND